MAIVERPRESDQVRILLVDDDEGCLDIARSVLQRAGHGVVACNGGAEALSVLTQQTFDVMVSDIQMPGIDGVKLLRAVREHDLDLPVVLVTGDPCVNSAADAVAYGAYRYLIKPVAIAELAAVVVRAAAMGLAARAKREYEEAFCGGAFNVGERAGVDAMLDRALSSLRTTYQPIVRAADSSIFGFEAFARVDEPAFAEPRALFAAAERVDRTDEVGRAIRENVAASARTAADEWSFFVNLHAKDLADSALFDRSSALGKLANRVVLEVTERVSLDDIQNVPARIAALRALGFRIALDDLGAGYAGLNTFAQLEPDFVKLDISLVRDVHLTPAKRKVVRAIVQLCKDMGKQVIAEGVERAEERRVLIELGCDLLQGYLFAKPSRPFPTVNLSFEHP